jgi:hypothetical protein
MRPRGLWRTTAGWASAWPGQSGWATGAASRERPAMVTAYRALMVARRVRAHCRPAPDKVFAWSIGAESGRRRARRGPMGLIEVVARRRGDRVGVGQRCSGVGDELW